MPKLRRKIIILRESKKKLLRPNSNSKVRISLIKSSQIKNKRRLIKALTILLSKLKNQNKEQKSQKVALLLPQLI